WTQAKDLNPDKEDLPKIEAKIKDGLPDDKSSAADADKAKKPGNGGGGAPLPASLVEDAPAKVNLTLRVLGRRADGYHEIESLVAFAGVGDALRFSPGGELALTVRGPSAAQAGASTGNL